MAGIIFGGIAGFIIFMSGVFWGKFTEVAGLRWHRCFRHKWSRWTDRKICNPNERIYYLYQERTCSRCNKTQRHVL